MNYIRLGLLGLAIFFGAVSCAHRTKLTDVESCQHSRHPLKDGLVDPKWFYFDGVTVTWELRYYVVGSLPPRFGDSMQLLKASDPECEGRVTGFVMEVIEPPEFAGQVLTAHFDGAGFADGFHFYEMGKRYTEDVPRQAIGQFHFGICR